MDATDRLQCQHCKRLTAVPAGFSRMTALELLPVCPACGDGSAWESWWRLTAVRASVGSAACGPDCWNAKSTICKCSCAGTAHGRN